ncbi:MAG: TraB/GumN family protein [Eubacteriales bacterium]|nr:TraB/GumN family protein [Eubacteriales bacterium]
MKKRVWLWVAVAAATLLAGALGYSLTHPAQGSRGILYHVTGGSGEMYLLGSIHIGASAMYPFGTEIQQAMAASDTFVYECDTTSAQAVAEVKARMALPAGQTLREQLGDTLYAELTQVCRKLNLATSALDTLKPWAVINTLAVYSTAAELGQTDVSEALSLGIEEQVRDVSMSKNKPTVYLETMDEQTDVLEGFSEALQRYLLKSECDTILDPQSVTGLDASVADWPAWWQSGDANAFAGQYLNSYLAPGYEDISLEYHTKLISQRNTSMAQRLDVLLKGGGTYFVTIGLLHLVLPEDSVPAQLEALGYTVSRVGD